MAVDKSNSTVRGRIYVCYPEFDANQRSIIRVRSSDNRGVTWTNPVTVSIANATQSFFPWRMYLYALIVDGAVIDTKRMILTK